MNKPYHIPWVDTTNQEKTLEITENGTFEIKPDLNKILKKATVNVQVNSEPSKPEQEKSITITENGTHRVDPDEGYTLSGVNIETNVVGGEIGKPYIDTSKITNFVSFVENNHVLIEQIDKIDTSSARSCERMFFDVVELETCPNFDTSECMYFSQMFYGCANLSIAPQLNTSKGETFLNMFRNCKKLKTIPLLDLSSASSVTYIFGGCESLETVSLTTSKVDLATTTFQNCTALKNLTIGEGWAVSIYLNYSNNLTVESLHGMIENLADLTGQTAKNFTIGETNLAKIDEEHLTMLDNKNWNYS